MFEVKHGYTLRDRDIVTAPEPTSTVEERLIAKREELIRGGYSVSMSTMWRKWCGFNTRGVVGCLDSRGMPGHVRLSSVDQKVTATLRTVMGEFTEKSTPTKKQLIEITKNRLHDSGTPLPSRSSMYSLLARLDRGQHTTGDATSRRSYANSPDRAFGTIESLYPGEEVQIDTTPLDAMVIMADGRTQKVDLAAAIDVSTRTITAAVLRVNASKTVDIIELIVRSFVPLTTLPGWQANMAMARQYLPKAMVTEAELDQSLGLKPAINVRGVVFDRGKIFVSKTFERALDTLGIDDRTAPPYTATAKPHIERLFKTIGDDFVRWIPGYKGRSINHRGRRPERDAVWPLPVLQALLDEWIATVYQKQSRRGTRLGLAPKAELSPNMLYNALSQYAPSPSRTLTRDEWISMQPLEFRRINRYGINLFGLVYDHHSQRFHDLRRTKSPNTKRNGKWEVRYDPNNLMQIWVRDMAVMYDERGREVVRDNGWIECPWKNAQSVTAPFGIDVLHAVMAELGKKERNDQRVLERAEQIHRTLMGGPSQAPHRRLTRAELSAGRANAARQELCVRPLSDATETKSPAVQSIDPPPSAPPPSEPTTTRARVEPMRPLRLSEGW
ncbi:Mu transposase C-terminal domain-containing protein [Mycobacteroides chelonae]|uniref:Mu transposase C-terminal domain-containing protein n=1 Tax=Mycobacteroides chelonae TaxID=1774 RepID=UPI0013F4C1C7|nr:Mu transposase C-terminal domain-containing protein [Mycobacteroides chelonae]